MSPVAQFEESARTAWRSDLSFSEKGKRLKAIRAAVLHYVGRLDGMAGGDRWDARTVDRTRSYLKALAADLEELSLECERAPHPKRPKMATGTYVA